MNRKQKIVLLFKIDHACTIIGEVAQIFSDLGYEESAKESIEALEMMQRRFYYVASMKAED